MPGPSTRTIARLPAPPSLLRLGQSVAMLDALVFPDDWSARYFSFDRKFGRGEQVFSMRNGEGDFWFLLFTKAGAVLHGFDHESPMSPWSRERRSEKGGPGPMPGLREGFPRTLDDRAAARAFCSDPNELTFLAWWTGAGPWRTGAVEQPKGRDPDGSARLLFILDGKPETWATWVEEYAEVTIALPLVRKLYAHEPLTKTLAAAINSSTSFADAKKEARAIGYPVAGE
ncbi:MAG: hypothetical protein JNJ54_01755 [Myxococcaceae bacterium]|nr:hypothetical protein [Myxococcaceae bacterium]